MSSSKNAILKLRVETYCLFEGKMLRVASQVESCDEGKMMSVRSFVQSVSQYTALAGRLWCFKLRTKQVQIVHKEWELEKETKVNP